ncbi:aminotransferase class IV [Naasia lichenicola]|uniref:Branched-chain amino acid aminotransferase n=1 Tax=Naasia lichenicola TaxID=2565933 RepID=A0A4S4FRK5_9MICO|nr:aminotransferase class IV [Naasia lichenicola]THG33290.1 branched-chain amino acid aminotransferase [Naasia lichenicola]
MTNQLTTVYINGEHVPVESASISVFDSGFNFGDGVFEGMRVYNGRVLMLDEHIERLYNSAAAAFIEPPMTQDELKRDILTWLRANDIDHDFHFRPIITRGIRTPPRVDPRFASGPATVVVLGQAISGTPTTGINLVVSRYRRHGPDSVDSKIKSLSYLHAVLAKLDAVRRGADDAIVLDNRGCLAECSASNIFLVKNGQLTTPFAISTLDGITRNLLLELAAELGIPAREKDLTTYDVHAADEVFLCGSGAELMPVITFETQTVGDGSMGPITERLRDAYLNSLDAHGTPIAIAAGV